MVPKWLFQFLILGYITQAFINEVEERFQFLILGYFDHGGGDTPLRGLSIPHFRIREGASASGIP